jgi:hypothetical protein
MIGKFLGKLGNIGKSVASGLHSFVGKVKEYKDIAKKKLNEFAEKNPGVAGIYEAITNIPTPFGGSVGDILKKGESFIDTAHARTAKFHSAMNDMARASGEPITKIAQRIMSTPEKREEIAPERALALEKLE